MTRREFVAASALAAAGAATASAAQGQGGAGGQGPREWYEWRRYELRMGTGQQRLGDYLRDVWVPAARRAGAGPIGVFTPVMGAPSPALYTLTPFTSLDVFATLAQRLADDEEYRKGATAYLATEPSDAVYVTMTTSLLHAFAGMPKLERPARAERGEPRIFEFRTYESHNERAGAKKIEMFDTGEIAIFRKTGLTPVFFGQTVAGAPMPSLSYMLTFADVAEREKNWDRFVNDPEWKALSGKPEYANAAILTRITAILLRPMPYSQV